MTKFNKVARTAFWIMLALVITSPISYTMLLNWLGPSTQYHNPTLPTAEPCELHGTRLCVYLGEEFFVNITVVRHKLNGTCRFEITRFAEYIGGPFDGQSLPVSYAVLQFVGQNEMRRVRWPSPPDKYILGHAVDQNNVPQLDKPLLPDGTDEQDFVFYVVGRYFCNFLDDFIPRYIQGGERPNETARVRVTVRRHRP